MGIKVNFAGVSSGFDPLPRGEYPVRVASVETKETGENSKKPGEDYWNVSFDIVGGEYEGRKLFTNFMLPPAYDPFMLKGFLKATGNYTDDELESELDIDEDDLIGLEALAVVEVKNDQNNVKRFKSLDGGSALP